MKHRENFPGQTDCKNKKKKNLLAYTDISARAILIAGTRIQKRLVMLKNRAVEHRLEGRGGVRGY